MDRRILATLAVTTTLGLSGCALDRALCAPHCQARTHNASSLVSFLYPGNAAPPEQNAIPELQVPLRVGLAFLPSQNYGTSTLDAAHEQLLLERIRSHFAGKAFVRNITIIPDYYLTSSRGFDGLRGVQRLYGVDLLALVSYDQVTYQDDNELSLGYLTILGAYILKGSRHDVTTLVDLAVVDPNTRSLVLRAGGTDTRHGDSTLIGENRDTRVADLDSFSAATDHMIGHFDGALTQFEADVRAGKANVRVTRRPDSGHPLPGGGGGMSGLWVVLLSLTLLAKLTRRSVVR